MDISLDRRAFLRHAGIAAIGVPMVTTLGCTLERQRSDTEHNEPLGPPRPILLPWGPDAVRIAAPPAERPVCYMSRGRMQIWVDVDFRERLQYLMAAHISVSTGRWRIPLPGDPPDVPVQPGDALREYEEIDMREWDASIEPVEGDVRVLRGSPVGVRVMITCQPVSGGGAYVSAPPLDLRRCGPPSSDITREDLMEVDTGTRFDDRDCARPTGSLRLVTWACGGGIIFSAV